jgi:hypothetical protein
MAYRTARETACVLAVILKRSGQTRARISALTVKNLALRETLRFAFVYDVTTALATDYGWIMFELSSGGYGAVQATALEAAKTVTAKRFLTDDERKKLSRESVDLADFEKEAAPAYDQPEEDE